MLLFWGLVLLGLVALGRWPVPKERHARGEIDRTEFEQKRIELEK